MSALCAASGLSIINNTKLPHLHSELPAFPAASPLCLLLLGGGRGRRLTTAAPPISNSILSVDYIFAFTVETCHSCSNLCAGHSCVSALLHVFSDCQLRICFFFFLSFSSVTVRPGHIDTLFPVQVLYPEPHILLNEIRIYRHHSLLRALTAGWFRPTRPQQLWGRFAL